MSALDERPILRRLLPAATLIAVPGLVLAGVPAGVAAPTEHVVSGSVMRADQQPLPSTSHLTIAQRTSADVKNAFYDVADGHWYRNLPDVPVASGTYSLSLKPGTYQLDFLTDDSTSALEYFKTIDVGSSDVPLDAVLDDPLACTTPGAITGTPAVGKSLTAVAGTFSPASYARTTTYQWWRYTAGAVDPWTMIDGARKQTYTATNADLGSQLEVDVSGITDHGEATCDYPDTDLVQVLAATPKPGTSVSGPRASALKFLRLGRPLGRARVGRRLRTPALVLRSPSVMPSGTTIAYQWYRIRRVHGVVKVQRIAHAHAARYRARRRDTGWHLAERLVITAPGYKSVTLNSRLTRVVRPRVGSAR